MNRFLLFLLGLGLVGCPATSGSDDDDSASDDDDATGDDDDSAPGLGGLDTDGDGVLRPADLDAGDIAVVLETPAGTVAISKESVGTSREGNGEYAFGDDFTYAGDDFWTVLLRLAGDDPLAAGTYDVESAVVWDYNANFDGQGVIDEDVTGSIELTTGGTATSGYLASPLTVDLESEGTPTGDTATIVGLAWNEIPVVN